MHRPTTISRPAPTPATKTWQPIAKLKGHLGHINDIAISADSRTLVSASEDSTLAVWHLDSATRLGTCVNGGPVCSVDLDVKNAIISGDFNSHVCQWDLHSRNHLQTYFEYFGSSHRDIVRSVAVNPSHASLASGGDDGVVRLWNRYGGDVRRTLLGHADSVRTVSYSGDGQFVVSGGFDGTVRVWDSHSGSLRWVFPHGGRVLAVVVSPDGTLVASGGTDGTVKLWELDTGTLSHVWVMPKEILRSLAFHPSGRLLACGSDTATTLWNVQNGDRWQTLDGRHPVSFSPDGSVLVTGSRTFSLKVWGLSPKA